MNRSLGGRTRLDYSLVLVLRAIRFLRLNRRNRRRILAALCGGLNCGGLLLQKCFRFVSDDVVCLCRLNLLDLSLATGGAETDGTRLLLLHLLRLCGGTRDSFLLSLHLHRLVLNNLERIVKHKIVLINQQVLRRFGLLDRGTLEISA